MLYRNVNKEFCTTRCLITQNIAVLTHITHGSNSSVLPVSQSVSRRPLNTEVPVRFQVSPRKICGGKSGTWTGLSASIRFSPVSIIPPLLHTHLSIYHPRCIMFFSQYFSFPCQYHSTIAPYSFTHLPPTLYNVFLPVLQFPLSVPFHDCSILIHSPTTHAV